MNKLPVKVPLNVLFPEIVYVFPFHPSPQESYMINSKFPIFDDGMHIEPLYGAPPDAIMVPAPGPLGSYISQLTSLCHDPPPTFKKISYPGGGVGLLFIVLISKLIV